MAVYAVKNIKHSVPFNGDRIHKIDDLRFYYSKIFSIRSFNNQLKSGKLVCSTHFKGDIGNKAYNFHALTKHKLSLP